MDSYGLPDTPLIGSEPTLTASYLAGLAPDEVVVQAVAGRVDSGDILQDPVKVAMTHTGTVGGNQIFSTTTPCCRWPVRSAVEHVVRVPYQRLLAGRTNWRWSHWREGGRAEREEK